MQEAWADLFDPGHADCLLENGQGPNFISPKIRDGSPTPIFFDVSQ